MTMMISSLKRRNEALQSECDTLAQGIDNLSNQINDAYEHLKKHEPEYVAEKLGLPARAASEDAPADGDLECGDPNVADKAPHAARKAH